MHVKTALACALATGFLIGGSALAQSSAPAPAAAPAAPKAAVPAPRAADVASQDSIIAALYDVISGPVGQARDWDRMRSLFLPEGHLMAVGQRPDGTIVNRYMTVEDYISRNAKTLVEKGFYENELAHTSETFGQITHVFTTYETRFGAKDAPVVARGINSVQLVNDGKRWWILSVLWRAEDANLKLPERYLHTH